MNDKIERLAELQIDRSAEPPPMGRWRYAVFAAIAVGGASLLLLRAMSPGAVTVESQVVRVAASAAGGNSVLDASGYVVARRQATVSSKVAGKILEVLIEEGMIVEKDQVVATLDSSTQRAQLALADARHNSATAALAEIQAQLTQAELELNRARELSQRQLASDSELDAANANAETLRARLATGRENVVVAQRSIDVSKDQLDNTIIRAPFAGVVVTKNAQPGEMISPISAGGGFTRTGICTIVDMDSLEIEVDVNEAYIQRVQPGQPVTAILDAYPDWRIPARVIAIVPTADRQKATVRVRVGFLERDGRIFRDMGVKVAFLRSVDADAPEQAASVYIASDALQSDSNGTFVWIVRGGAVHRRSVMIGQSSSSGLQIMSGLGAGDRVVVSSPEELTAGQPVEILN